MSIDYARMRRESPKLKAMLTRAVKSGDRDKVVAACERAVTVWDEVGAWPDNWARWERALRDAYPYPERAPELGTLSTRR